jgi:hypothetical protein
LAMTVKEKVTVRLVIDAIAEKQRWAVKMLAQCCLYAALAVCKRSNTIKISRQKSRDYSIQIASIR